MGKILREKVCKKLVLLILSMVSMLFLTTPTSSLALTISPPRLEFNVNPGQRVEDIIKIFNETKDPLNIFTSAANFVAKPGETGEPEFLFPKDGEEGLAAWIDIEKGPITILPNEQKIIPFTVRVPPTADPGGHYAAIFFSPSPPPGEGGVVGVIGKLGALVLFRVSGDIKEEGGLTEFSLKDNKKAYNHLPVDFVIRFENTGTVHLKPQGDIFIKNIFGRESAIVEVNKPKIGTGGNVLPNSIRRFEASWDKKEIRESEPTGFLEKLKTEIDNFAFGRYRADLILDYGTLGKKSQATLIFWVIPWRLTVLTIIGLLILIFLLIISIKRYNRWIIKKALEQMRSQ